LQTNTQREQRETNYEQHAISNRAEIRCSWYKSNTHRRVTHGNDKSSFNTNDVKSNDEK